MAWYECLYGGGSNDALTTSLTLKKSDDSGPMGAMTIADGINAYKYIYMCRVQVSSSTLTIRDDAFMSIDDFITVGSVTVGTTNSCTITYTNNNTITITQSSSTQKAYVVLFK